MIDPVGSLIGGWGLIVIQVTVALAVIAVVERCMHRASASWRHAVWGAGMVLCLVLPGAQLLLPKLSVLPRSWTVTTSVEPVAPNHTTLAVRPDAQASSPSVGDEVTRERFQSTELSEQPVRAVPSQAAAFFDDWLWVVGTLYGLGVVLGTARLVASVLLLGRIVRAGRVVGQGPLVELSTRTARDLGLGGRPLLVASDRATIPFACRVLYPTVVIGPNVEAMSVAEQRAILLHEQGHILRRDPLWQWILGLAHSLFWWHPLLWYAAKRMTVLREHACDDLVVAHCDSLKSYAQLLVSVTADHPPARPVIAVAIVSSRSVERRIRKLFAAGANRAAIGARNLGWLLAVVLLLGVPVSLLRTTTATQAAADGQNEGKAADAESSEVVDGPYTAKLTLQGTVRSRSGDAIGGAQVYLAARQPGYRLLAQTECNASGVYSFSRIDLPIGRSDFGRTDDHGDFEVFAVADDFALGWLEVKSFYPNGAKGENPSRPKHLPPRTYDRNDEIAIDLYLARPKPFSGQVLDDQGKPIPRAQLNIRVGSPLELSESTRPEEGHYAPLASFNSSSIIPQELKIQRTDEEGRFTFNRLPPDHTWSVDVTARECAKRRVSIINGPRESYVGRGPVYQTGDDIVLPRTVQVPVQVVFADTLVPAEDVMVSIRNAGGTGSHWSATDQEGKCTLRVPPGECNLAILPAYQTPFWRTHYDGIQVSEGLDPDEPLVFSLDRAATVELLVVDGLGRTRADWDLYRERLDPQPNLGPPILDGLHTFRSYERAKNLSHGNRARTDDRGRLKTFFLSGKYKLRVQAADSHGAAEDSSEWQEVELTAGETTRLLFRIGAASEAEDGGAKVGDPADVQPAPSAAAQPPAVRPLHFIVARHAIIYAADSKKRVIDSEELRSIVEDAAQESEVRMHFHSTRAGGQNDHGLGEVRRELYARLFEQGRTKGMSIGWLSSSAYDRWDRIRTDADLAPDPSRLRQGTVVSARGVALENASVILLPKQRVVGVYLRNGRIRNPLEEHMVRTDQFGTFQIAPDEDEHWMVVAHPLGFMIASLDELGADWRVQVKPWAVIHGRLEDRAGLSEFPLSITSYPIRDLSVQIYETETSTDGKFVQRFVPPGQVYAARSFKTARGSSMAFPEHTLTLRPGERKLIRFGPVTDEMRAAIERGP